MQKKRHRHPDLWKNLHGNTIFNDKISGGIKSNIGGLRIERTDSLCMRTRGEESGKGAQKTYSHISRWENLCGLFITIESNREEIE